MFKNQSLNSVDSEIYAAIQAENLRQEQQIELIASENYTSLAVMQAQGSKLTNKYAEGYPKRRFYGGCINVDRIEKIAIQRAKDLFGAEYANVQPHSGSQANQAVFHAFLNPGDSIMGMDLGHGGHLTHGSKVNISGKLFNVVSYGLNENAEIDYDKMEELALRHKIKLLIGGASSYALQIDFERMADIAKKAGAYFLVDMAHYSGLIAAGVYKSPVKYADFVTSTTHKTLRGPRGGFILAKEEYGKKLDSSVFPSLQGGPLMHVIAAKAVAFKEASTLEFKNYQNQILKNSRTLLNKLQGSGLQSVSKKTDCHMFLVDLRSFDENLTGKVAEELLERAHITLNKNAIPNDPRPASISSGIRIGCAAITTRGFKEKETEMVGDWILRVLSNPRDEVIDEVRNEVLDLCARYPVYEI